MQNIQELEEQNYFPQSETMNCYEEAGYAMHMEQSKQGEKIQSELSKGKIVVVTDAPWYCRATDAIVGSCRYFYSSHNSRQEAEAATSTMEQDYELTVKILPEILVQRICTPVCDSDEDIPF